MAVSKKKILVTEKPIHPWRLCPYGEHWVRKHPLHVPPSRRHPAGSVTTRRAHCARNPSGKDQLYPDEITEIANLHFSNLKNKPCPRPFDFQNGSKFDSLIAGWTQYWNDIFKPVVPLDPNLVKALIASESSFIPNKLANPKNQDSARGLMQITNDTREILDDDTGEIKDHYVTATREELDDPGTNICAGIRWLFQKRQLASSRLKRQATWTESVYEYKGASLAKNARDKTIMQRFNNYYEKYQKCGK